jgi:hypothetical protein
MKPLEAIRIISGIFENDNQQMQNRLAIINMICRTMENETDQSFADEILSKAGIKIDWQTTKREGNQT